MTLSIPMTRGDIVRALSQEILDGRLPPGSILPTRTQLIARFHSTSATVQHAVDILRREGFVYANGNRGTFVSPRPPHLFRFAMVFSGNPHEAQSNRLYQQLCAEAAHYNGSDAEPRRIELHFGVENHVDNPELKTLLSSVHAFSLAGIILPQNPFATNIAGTELGTAPGLPRVTLAAPPPETGSRWGQVRFGEWSPIAVRHLAEAGCRRVAVLTTYPTPAGIEADLMRRMADHGIRTAPHWFLAAPLDGPSCARNIVHVLLSSAQKERPDGLLITNDTLMEDAVAGVVASGIRLPEELRIVSHCNFPWPIPSAVPVTRIGYQTRDLVAACLDELAAQRQGAAPSSRTVAPIFERDQVARSAPQAHG